MIKNIKYNGYTARPADYEAPDGDLALSLNLINKDGNIHGVTPPKEILSIADGHSLLIEHSVYGGTQKNLIFLTGDRENSFGLAWMIRKNPSADDISLPSSESATPIPLKEHLSGFRSITVVGNVLAVATADGLFYILWKDDTYKPLGKKPPFIPISLGAYYVGRLSGASETSYSNVPSRTFVDYSGNYPSGANKPQYPWTTDDDSFWQSVSDQAVGLLQSEVADKVTSKGNIYQPCFIRYAYRLYDGSYCWHSAPVLLLVSTAPPVIKIQTSGSENNVLNVTCLLGDIFYFHIAYRTFGDIDSLKDWSNIVTGIDFFITPPVYTFDPAKRMKRPVLLNTLLRQNTNTGYSGSRNDGFAPGYTGSSGSSTETTTPTTDPDADTFLSGHYAGALNGGYIDHFETMDHSDHTTVCDLRKDTDFVDNLKNQYLFYKVASIDIDDLKPMSQMARLNFDHNDLSAITSLPLLPDEYNSHAEIIPGSLYAYNQRLIMSDISMRPPSPLPFCSVAAKATKSADDLSSLSGAESVKVFSRINGAKCVTSYTNLPTSSLDFEVYPFDDSFPRFIYHPDPNAYRMEITSYKGKVYTIPLSRHNHLNGAFWFGGFGKKPVDVVNDLSLDTCPDRIAVANKTYVSDVNNPFLFPPSHIISIGCGRVFDVCTAAKALSQGQFGQFPLYAFTDEGVWALEISSTGAISARQPLSRDVCINPDAITQLDSAVLFPTARGIMHISGSQTQCISETINSDHPFNLLDLPSFDKLHRLLGHNADTCLPVAPFSKFLENCGMIYDYIHQRVVVFNSRFTYAYIFSLKSQAWGMIFSDIERYIKSYPEALAVNSNRRLVDLTLDGADTCPPGLLVTRPLKLDNPDLLKTVDTVIQRGYFSKGNIRSVLYGSRDLINWHLVWSSKDHYLRGFRGTPYKYFRLALLCNLTPAESLFSASVQFTPRLTNRPR